MLKDLSILQDLGCNIVRGSHYPQSQFWMDLLDEHGMLLWSEIPMWGCFMSVETLASPLFAERGVKMLDEMITRDYHHPSIIFWELIMKLIHARRRRLSLRKVCGQNPQHGRKPSSHLRYHAPRGGYRSVLLRCHRHQ